MMEKVPHLKGPISTTHVTVLDVDALCHFWPSDPLSPSTIKSISKLFDYTASTLSALLGTKSSFEILESLYLITALSPMNRSGLISNFP